VTPEERERLARYLGNYAAGVVSEWMRIVDLEEDVLGPGSGFMQARATWVGENVFKLGEHALSEEFGHYRLKLSVEPVEVPPIGPENDPALIEEMREEPLSTPDVPEWVETTWLYVQNYDRVRLNGQEADVTKYTKNNFHAKVDTWTDRVTGRERDNVTGKWDHVEVIVELAHIPGKPLPFPPNMAVEVLMDRERKAVHLLATEMGGEVLS
jgi:hypothetical protein